MSSVRSTAARMGLCALLVLVAGTVACADEADQPGMECTTQCYDAEDTCEKACPASAEDGEACRATCAETGDGCRQACPGGGGEPTDENPIPD